MTRPIPRSACVGTIDPNSHSKEVLWRETRHFGERYIVPRLSDWLKKYPKIQLELELAERIPDLVKEQIDILVGMSMPGPPDCIQKRIAQTRYVYCASPDYLECYGIPKNLSELKDHAIIAHSMRPDESIRLLDDSNEPALSIYLCTASRKFMQAKVRSFIEFCENLN